MVRLSSRLGLKTVGSVQQNRQCPLSSDTIREEKGER